MKTSAGWFSPSIRREGEDEDCVEMTTSVLTLSDERVGLGGDEIDHFNFTLQGESGIDRDWNWIDRFDSTLQ